MMIILGADHGGYELKEKIKEHLSGKGMPIMDEGAHSLDPKDDYSPFALNVAKKVGAAEEKKIFQDDVKGILICRSAAGMVIAANKVKGVRAVAAFDLETARHSREHNASNVLAISGDRTSEADAFKIIDQWISTPFSHDKRHERRLKIIYQFEST
ncbi:RpiB/LacA/LacB family sugar-phosphate isomerase [Candidatus Woesearchaeota archaeon]|nr:RpiB/LacA/LacB family sugar-phosphate isomerase [Candidatus Woesearchaeota archaeon]